MNVLSSEEIIKNMEFANGIMLENLKQQIKILGSTIPENEKDAIYRALMSLGDAKRALNTLYESVKKVEYINSISF